jgi:hypothetical protein
MSKALLKSERKKWGFLDDSIWFSCLFIYVLTQQPKGYDDNNNIIIIKKLRGFSPQANYTDRATAACRRS